MIHAAIWIISFCIVVFFGGLVLLLAFGTVASIPEDAWYVIIFMGIGLAILANNHFQHQIQLRNQCEQQVFQVFPPGSVHLQDSSFYAYTDALMACESKYSFWKFSN